jgi:hypothetical protein
MAKVTELLAVPRPVVFGFLRTHGHGARTAALTTVVSEYCKRHELALHDVVIESPQEGDAFMELLLSVSRADAYGVVVPSRSHLGIASVAATRRDAIARARLRLIMVRLPTSTPKGARWPVREVDGNDARITSCRRSCGSSLDVAARCGIRAVTSPPPISAHRSAHPDALSRPGPEPKRSVEWNGGSRRGAK